MKGIIKKMPFRWLGRFNGITIVPYIFIYKDAYKDRPVRYAAFINHENIHVRQVDDVIRKHKKKIGFLGNITGWITWYAGYLKEYAVNIKKYGKAAYRNISYEREAYANQYDLAYLEDREDFAHLDYKD